MKAIAVNGDHSLSLVTCEDPTPGPEDVLIEVRAAGINRADLAQRAGKYPPPPGASQILGLEVSGQIAALGRNVSGFQVRDRVCALLSGGGYAERVVVPAAHLISLGSEFSYEEAAAIPEAFFTAYVNIFLEGAFRTGERVLIHGGSSGVGTSAIQMCALAGGTVFTTVRNQAKADAVRAIGAHEAIVYSESDFVSAVLSKTENRGVDLILCNVGGDYFQRNLSILATGGRLVQIAFLHGAEVSLNLSELMKRRARVIGSTLRSRSDKEKAEITAGFVKEWWPRLVSKELNVVIDSVYPFEKVEEAHARMKSSEHIGKIVLRMP